MRRLDGAPSDFPPASYSSFMLNLFARNSTASEKERFSFILMKLIMSPPCDVEKQ